MKVISHDTADGFLEAALPLLMQNEVLNNLPIGIALSVAEGRRFGDEPPYFATIWDGEDLVGTTLRTPPHPLHVFAVAGREREIAEPLVEWLIVNDREVPVVVGERKCVEAFTTVRSKRLAARAELKVAMRVFRLDEVKKPEGVAGSLRLARAGEEALLEQWVAAFNVSIGEPRSETHVRESVARMLANGQLYLWEDPERGPVSCACNARKTVTGEVVNLVYTPDEYRGNGYASAAVAELSDLLLKRGAAFCCLFTNLANPISNKIYQRIGYQSVGDYASFAFSE